jgi:hypothetical protein
MKTEAKRAVISMARSSFRDGPWARPGNHEHRLLNPFSQARVHGFRARGRSPRPGMTGRNDEPFSSQMAHACLWRAEILTRPFCHKRGREDEGQLGRSYEEGLREEIPHEKRLPRAYDAACDRPTSG